MEEVTRGAQTRRALLDAAIARFGRDGYRATAVTAVARDAGVGGTAPYLYFADKEALFYAAADDDVAGIIDEIFSSVDLAPDDPAWPETVLVSAVTLLDRHPLARRILAGLEPDAAARLLEMPALAQAGKLLADALAEGQASGAVRTDVTPDELSGGLLTIILALLAGNVRFGLGTQPRMLESIVATLHAAVVPGR